MPSIPVADMPIGAFPEIGAATIRSASTGSDLLKRAFDIVGSVTLLVVTTPVLVVAGLAVRMTSPGPVLFRQDRVGKGESRFRIVKFRTMIVNHAGAIDVESVQAKEKSGILTKSDDDPRITPVGRFLRRTSIDELPQLWNILRGEMSLVGPRPLLPFMLEPYPELRRARCVVRPGLTGLWQVNKRDDNTSALSMAEQDLEYVASQSLRLDLKTLLRTIPAIVRGAGAV